MVELNVSNFENQNFDVNLDVESIYNASLELEKDFKYNKIDCLDEDPPINGQRFVCLSFVCPEGVMNCNVRGLKVRGVYGSQSEANKACEKFTKMDPSFDVLVGEVGKWLPWNPTSKQIEKINYKNKKLDKIMENVHKSELNTLNELVGRTKDVLKKDRKSHKNRIAQALNDNIANLDEKDDEVVEEQPKKIKSKSRNSDDVRARLKSKLEKSRQEKESVVNAEVTKTMMQNQAKLKQSAETTVLKEQILENQTSKMKAEAERITNKETAINKLENKTIEIEDKLAKMKEYLKQKKLEKSSKN